jgi:hypothetical protein
MKSIKILFAAAAFGLAATTAGCAGGGSSVTEPTRATTPPPTPTPTPTPTPVAATCENTVTAEASDAFAKYSWTARAAEEPFAVGGVAIPDGIACVWGDYSVGTDNVSWLAWGPLDAAAMKTAIAGLLAEGGWRQEQGDAGIYITAADTDMLPVTDADGYGMTYLFADGQVKGATTRSELGVIVAPEGFAG